MFHYGVGLNTLQIQSNKSLFLLVNTTLSFADCFLVYVLLSSNYVQPIRKMEQYNEVKDSFNLKEIIEVVLQDMGSFLLSLTKGFENCCVQKSCLTFSNGSDVVKEM